MIHLRINGQPAATTHHHHRTATFVDYISRYMS